MLGFGMSELIIIVVVLALVVAIFRRKKTDNLVEQKSYSQVTPRTVAFDNAAEARKHYRKGDNLWAESFHAALAEYEMALQLEPDNPDYQFAVNHAKHNIELDEKEQNH